MGACESLDVDGEVIYGILGCLNEEQALVIDTELVNQLRRKMRIEDVDDGDDM